MNKILSIVIPTYNMEKYLERCLSSLLISDNEAFNALEVLVVNDGSKDKSSIIAHGFQDKFPAVFTIIDKPNGNYGSCINAALKVAKGKYIKILDADDSFDRDGFSKFVEYINTVDVDMILSDFDMVNSDGKVIRHHSYSYLPYEFYPMARLNEVKEMWMHAVTYRTDNLREIGYYQTEGISYTDQEWIFLPVSTVSTFSYFPQTVYEYTVDRSGQTIDPAVFIRRIDDEIIGFKVMIDEYLKSVWPEDQYKYLTNRLLVRAGAIYSAFLIYYVDNLDLNKLVDLDRFLFGRSPELYRMIGNIKPPFKLITYKYVNVWRKNNHQNNIVNFFLHVAKEIRRFLCRK